MATVTLRREWAEGHLLSRLLERFNSGTSVNSDGAISFDDWDFEQTFSLLDDAFRYPDALAPRELSALIYRAVIDLRKAGPVKAEALVAAVNASASSALSTPEFPFVMWTTLRLTDLHRSGGFDLNYKGVSLQARAKLPRWLRVDNYLLSGFKRIEANNLPGFGYLMCRVRARNEDSAARRIFEATDLFMALTNVAWRQWNIFGGEHHAEAKLWEGPYQFFWEGGRFLGSERIWFNAEFNLEEWKHQPKRGAEFKKHLPIIRKGLEKLERHPLAVMLSRTLRLMQDGMASRDSSYRLLRFWSALETLYAKEGETRTNVMIERALFAEGDDRTITRAKLQYLSKIRNQYVHAGLENDNIYHLIQFLRDMVAGHLMYLIYHGEDFAAHEDYLAMCSLPGDIGALEKRRLAIDRRENIIKLRRHKSP